VNRVTDEYLEALVTGDASAAVELLDQALMKGMPPVLLIRDVIALGQREVGEGWADGWLNMADEHAATAVSEQALSVVSQSLPSPDGGKRVVFACAEGEWHAMPARLAGEQARAAGLRVTMLGASLPAEHLHAYLLSNRPDVVALSVTLASNLVGASRSIQAAHRAGVPVIVGGAGWGSDDTRARALGADAWLGDVRDLPVAVDRVLERPDLAASPPLGPDATLLTGAPVELAQRTLDRHVAGRRGTVSLTARQAQDRLEDYQWLMRYAAAAVACNDTSVVEDMLSRWTRSIARQGFDPHWVAAACEHLAAVVCSVAPASADMLREAGERHAAVRACHDLSASRAALREGASPAPQYGPELAPSLVARA
jgi:methanogenic corrinoid protein MtbC1